jgi:hypothetical protein
LDFSCEITANNTAVFLGFFFWEQHDFGGDGVDMAARDNVLSDISKQWSRGDRQALPLGVTRGG